MMVMALHYGDLSRECKHLITFNCNFFSSCLSIFFSFPEILGQQQVQWILLNIGSCRRKRTRVLLSIQGVKKGKEYFWLAKFAQVDLLSSGNDIHENIKNVLGQNISSAPQCST